MKYGGEASGALLGMQSLQSETLDKPGFTTSGYIDKKGTPSGESAMFNKLPPGQDITRQDCAEFNNMPMRKLTALSYPGDGAFATRDVPE